MWASLLLFAHAVLARLPALVSSRVYAAIFTASIGLNLTVSAPIYASTVALKTPASPTSPIPAAVYSQTKQRKPPPPSARTIVIVHGVSSTAHEDPRIVALARALAAAHPSNVVVVPYIPQIAQIRLQDRVVDAITDILTAVRDDSSLCPARRLSVVSMCISGGFSLVAATYVHFVESMLLVGPHSSVHNALHHALKTKGSDDSRYGINSVLASFYHPPNERVVQMLKAYCVDDHKRNVDLPSDELRPLLKQFPQEAQEYQRLHHDDQFLTDKLQQLYSVHREAMDSMSPVLRLERLDTRSLTLVHSLSDEIVPPRESVLLEEALRPRDDVSVACMITSLLNHGDQTPLGLGRVPEILRLVNTFANFFIAHPH